MRATGTAFIRAVRETRSAGLVAITIEGRFHFVRGFLR
jgi:hypothetical protein